jgi:hypothetical protein
MVETIAFVATVLFAMAALALQAIPPLLTLRIMLALHRLEWRAVGLMAPLALGALATLICLIMAAATAGRRLTPQVWVWLMCGAFVAPIAALGAYRVANHLLTGGPPA